MRETRADTTQGVFLALLLHALLFALMFVGLWWSGSSSPAGAAGAPVSAELMEFSDLSAAMRRTLQKRPEPVQEPEPPQKQPIEEDATPLPQPILETNPQDSQVEPQFQAQERIPEPSDIDQEKVERDAISAETREREQEEKRRQEQIDLTERQRQEEIEKKQRLAQQQKDQEELKKIQAEMAKTEREANLAEQKLKQIANLRASQASQQAATSVQPPGQPQGTDNGLLARYQEALREAILRNWTRPDNVPIGQRCRIVIRQLPGGEVIDAKVDPSCPYDELGRRSVEAAVLKAQPLPYAGFEAVFSRTLTLNFEAQDR